MKNMGAEGNLMRTFENEVLHGDKMTGPLTEVRHQCPLGKGGGGAVILIMAQRHDFVRSAGVDCDSVVMTHCLGHCVTGDECCSCCSEISHNKLGVYCAKKRGMK